MPYSALSQNPLDLTWPRERGLGSFWVSVQSDEQTWYINVISYKNVCRFVLICKNSVGNQTKNQTEESGKHQTQEAQKQQAVMQEMVKWGLLLHNIVQNVVVIWRSQSREMSKHVYGIIFYLKRKTNLEISAVKFVVCQIFGPQIHMYMLLYRITF